MLDEILPVLDVEHDLILSKEGDVTMVLQVELPEIFTLSEMQYESFHQAWVKAKSLADENGSTKAGLVLGKAFCSEWLEQ